MICVVAACSHIATSSGSSTPQEMALPLAPAESFKVTIRMATPADLQLFMVKMLDFSCRRQQYETQFGGAMINVVEACHRIVKDSSK